VNFFQAIEFVVLGEGGAENEERHSKDDMRKKATWNAHSL
jgi:hypothetical protein